MPQLNKCGDDMNIPFARDTLQKLSLIAFAQAILEVMGDDRKVVRFHPTELIIPSFRRQFMDGVMELDDGSLMNIEFFTGNITEKFLLRCAQYAINLRVISRKYVETCIFSTGLRSKSKTVALISKFFFSKPKLFFYSEFNGSKRLLSIKNKIENNEKLTLVEGYDLVFIPLMGKVDRKKVACEVFEIANDVNLFTADERSYIKQCQYIVAQIIADGDDELFKKFWEIIKMNNDFLVRYENDLIERTTRDVTDDVTKSIAKNFKDVLPDEVIAERTGLSLRDVKNL